jgi:hypothetical protein
MQVLSGGPVWERREMWIVRKRVVKVWVSKEQREILRELAKRPGGQRKRDFAFGAYGLRERVEYGQGNPSSTKKSEPKRRMKDLQFTLCRTPKLHCFGIHHV